MGRDKVKKAAYDRKYHKSNKVGRVARATRWNLDNRAKRKRHQAAWQYKAKYGISIEEKQVMFDKQSGRCFNVGCKKTFSSLSDAKIDHNHQTGQIRKLLCSNCNLALGLLYESPPKILGLASYLEEYEVFNPR